MSNRPRGARTVAHLSTSTSTSPASARLCLRRDFLCRRLRDLLLLRPLPLLLCLVTSGVVASHPTPPTSQHACIIITSMRYDHNKNTNIHNTRAPRTDQRWRHVFTQLQPDAGCLGAKPQPNAGKGPSDVHRSMRRRDVRLGLLHTAVGLCHRRRLWVRGCHMLTPPLPRWRSVGAQWCR